MKRFYKTADVVRAASGLGIVLDGRPVRTPKKAPLAVAGTALAEAIAEEWRQQDDEIVPDTMPMLRLANTAIDVVAGQREAVIDNLAGYGGSDLLCYRAAEQDELARRQDRLWSPWLDWVAGAHGAQLATTNGIGPMPQAADALAALHRAVAAHDEMELAALNDLVSIPGSLVLGLAVSAGALAVDDAWQAARVDNDYQSEHWGRDAEAEAHAAHLRRELEQAARFLDLHRAG